MNLTDEQLDVVRDIMADLIGIADDYRTYGDWASAEAIDGIVEYIKINYVDEH